MAKADFHLTNSSNLAVTYTRGRPFRREPAVDIRNDGTFYGFQERGTASFVTSGAAWTSETRFGYNLNDLETIDEFLLNGIAEETQFGRRTPQIVTSLGFSTPTGQVWRQHGPTWTLEEKYARHMGKHSLKFGANFMRSVVGRTKLTAPAVQYQGMPDLLANVPSQINITFGAALHDGFSHAFGAFAQDDWRVSSKLTVNLGARYDYYLEHHREDAGPEQSCRAGELGRPAGQSVPLWSVARSERPVQLGRLGEYRPPNRIRLQPRRPEQDGDPRRLRRPVQPANAGEHPAGSRDPDGSLPHFPEQGGSSRMPI